jgi:hypothetical protein
MVEIRSSAFGDLGVVMGEGESMDSGDVGWLLGMGVPVIKSLS